MDNWEKVILVPILFVLSLIASGSWVSCDEKGIMQDMTDVHNQVREEVGVQGLVWSDELAAFAQEWADNLSREKNCTIMHRNRQRKIASAGPGENIYWASALLISDGTKALQEITPEKVVQKWAAEVLNYSYDQNSCRVGSFCGHYTQIVWKATTRVGCGRAVCADKGQIWVCNYEPPGNVVGTRPY